MKQNTVYEGASSIYYMCIKNPDLWNNFHGWMIEEIAPIWEKLFIHGKKSKLYRWEKDLIDIHTDAFKSYTHLVHLYHNLPEETKDQYCKEWNDWTQKY